MDIHYVTSNKAKFEEAQQVLLSFGDTHSHTICHTPLELEEIQGTKEEIANSKIRQAVAYYNAPCIIDDVSLFCPALGGLPGPYIRSFLEALGDEKFAELIAHYPDRSCSVTCCIAFMKPGDSAPHLFEGVIEGHIVPPRGTRKDVISWNAIVQPLGYTQTYAELSLEQMSRHSPRSKALGSFSKFLLSNTL